jgi:autotransporter-associated beta strand protein
MERSGTTNVENAKQHLGELIMASRYYSASRMTAVLFIVAASALTNVALGQYTFVQDTDASGAWDDPANWLDGGSNTTYPNAPDATVLIPAPTWTGSSLYTLAMPSTDTTVGRLTIDNTNHANNFRTNFTNGGGKLIFQSTSGPATFTETAGSAPGATNSQYQIMPIVDLLSDLVITQNNYPNLNTGTIFTNLVNGASNLSITKEGFGGIQFNYNALPLFEGEGFEGQYVINRGGIRLIGRGAIDKSLGVTVNSGGQLQLADNAGTVITDWNVAPGAILNLNGSGKEFITGIATPEGALRIAIQAGRSTAFHNPVVLQSDTVISVATATTTGTLDGGVSGPGGLTKHGDGTLILSNASDSYGGDTHVLTAPTATATSTLSIANPILPNGRDVYLSAPRTALDLNFSATDAIRSLFLDGVAQPTGTYGAVGNASADFQSTLITGSGLLQVTTLPVTENADFDGDGDVDGADFLTWQRGLGGPGGLAQGDANGDSTVNAADLGIWTSQFGTGAPSVRAAAAIPEPAAAVVAMIAAGVALIGRRRRSR